MPKIAIVGTGGVATRHAEALGEIDGATLAGCWSRSQDNRDRFAATFRCTAYPSFKAMLADGSVDAVLVLSNADTHVEYSLRALQAGKHVLVEKPVGRSPDEICRLRDEACKYDRVCMPSHNYIYAPETQRLHHHAASGRLGRLHSFWMIYHHTAPLHIGKPGFMMEDMMVHHAYTSLYFAGKPDRLVSVASNVRFEDPAAEDQIGITCVYRDGRIANLWASWATEDRSRDPWSVTMKVFGENGTGVYGWDSIKNDHQPNPAWDDGAYWDSFYNV